MGLNYTKGNILLNDLLRSDISMICVNVYQTVACPEFYVSFHEGMGCNQKHLYHTLSVVVTPAPVWVPIQRPLIPMFA